MRAYSFTLVHDYGVSTCLQIHSSAVLLEFPAFATLFPFLLVLCRFFGKAFFKKNKITVLLCNRPNAGTCVFVPRYPISLLYGIQHSK